MNYIISSIVLLAVIMIIIYILSIDNNTDKLKNKFKEIFSVVKSKEINYLNDKDNKNLLLYVKQHFKYNNIDIDNITIPSKIFYNKTERGYEMNNINIICYKYLDNGFQEKSKKINILFVPFEKENYISDQSLFGLHGNYMIENIIENNIDNNIKNILEPIISKPPENKVIEKTVKFNNNEYFIPQNNNYDNQETYTDVLDMIPDIIHLTEDDSIMTTDTAELISHNLK
jgi:hypothetical protein